MKKPPKLKAGKIVVHVKLFVAGNPVGLGTDTRAVVKEVSHDYKRVRLERDDGREGSWWVDVDNVEIYGG